MQLSEEATFDILDRAMVLKAIKAAEVAGRKSIHYGGLAQDNRTKAFFESQEKVLQKTVNDLNQMVNKLN